MIEADGVAEHVEFLREFHFTGGDSANGFAFGSALIDAAVIFAGGLAVVQAANTEGRGNAAVHRRSDRIAPEAGIGNGIAKAREQMHFFGSGMERFDFRSESDILRRKVSLADGYFARGDGLIFGGKKIDGIDAWLFFYGDGHEAERRAAGLREKFDSAALEFCGSRADGSRTFEAKRFAELNSGGSGRALLTAGGKRNRQQKANDEN